MESLPSKKAAGTNSVFLTLFAWLHIFLLVLLLWYLKENKAAWNIAWEQNKVKTKLGIGPCWWGYKLVVKKGCLSTSNPVGPNIVNQHILWWRILLVWVINTWNSIESILGTEKSINQFLQNSMNNPIAKSPNAYNIALPFPKLLYQYCPSIYVLWHSTKFVAV